MCNSRAMNWNTKGSKKTDAHHSWEMILPYSKIYCGPALWEEDFDKLIISSFLLSTCLHSQILSALQSSIYRQHQQQLNPHNLKAFRCSCLLSWGHRARGIDKHLLGACSVLTRITDVLGCMPCYASTDAGSQDIKATMRSSTVILCVFVICGPSETRGLGQGRSCWGLTAA